MKSAAKRYGITGAICLPIILGALVVIRGNLPFDSFMYSALQKIFYTPTIPLFWLMDKILGACGIQGDEGMAFIFPMFLAMLLYWAIMGFGFGWVLGKIKRKSAQQGGPGYSAQGALSPDP